MKGLEGGVNGEYLTDRLTAEALKWVEKNKDQPFFLYLAQFGVHDPIQGRGDLVVKYEKKLAKMGKVSGVPFVLEGNPDDGTEVSGTAQDEAHKGFKVYPDRTVKIKQRQDNVEFAAMVDCIDENFGRVMAKLKELGLADNTIVIFFSDNGGMSAANFGNPSRNIQPVQLNKAYSTSNLPLRGGKGWLYEGGIREPMLVYWPGHGLHGVTSDVPVTSTDFYPTILDMVGLDAKPRGSNGIDGSSLVPILKGEAAGTGKLREKPLFWHFPHYSNHGAQSPGGAVRYGDYKLIEYYENNMVQLFNLKNDPGEHQDLAKTEPAKAKELTAMLHEWRKQVGAVMPKPNPQYKEGLKWPGNGIKGEEDSPYDKKDGGGH
jgi:arylsulfatase A-like enzyme